ncbi:hypothetical protein GGG87_03410 [Streptococcus sp. zg-86]|uniref:Uncharacterized protein n=1 Tax=Streptococcus zhangguiae TaxID=2664091 RepID=A0A6I4R939_9STRE|nr:MULTISPECIES: hypothetical protein [unclassified Streptococcus]MTB64051.1 hypothetical protein [Streptococcus sp. zg-86]MTB90361.1 hypothetical protein [Streptococcus sp. zg-36]MWV56039.1 hypothetical protein [Streptococcus sp. zg-70]QTH47076.1 hypothetical protein J5M87_05770 [Streptococcus sp. zg-86]
MFGKLLKYEFKAVGKWYLGLYAAAGLLSVVLGFWIQNIVHRPERTISDTEIGASLANTLEGILFGAIIIGFAVIIAGLFLSTFFLIIKRFRKNVYGRQGYLTMTLPVTNHQIILSKLTAAFIWSTLSGIATILCLWLISSISFGALLNEYIPEITAGFNEAYHEFTGMDFGISYAITLIVGTIHSILLIYFAISLGQLFKDHRTLLAVVFYFGINFVEGLISAVFVVSTGVLANSTTLAIHTILGIIISIILAIGYYFGTYYIMTKKLNLQ